MNKLRIALRRAGGRFHKQVGRLTSLGVGIALSATSAFAAANTNATAMIDDGEATFQYALPVGLGIMGTFLAIAIGRTAWKRFAK